MPEEKDPKKTEPQYTPASPVKRTAAWIGIVYMVIVVILTTYIYAMGKPLTNLGPLLAVPALIGLGAMSIVSWRSTGRPSKWAAIVLAVVLWIIAAYTLVVGMIGLLSNFPGALDALGLWLGEMFPGTMFAFTVA